MPAQMSQKGCAARRRLERFFHLLVFQWALVLSRPVSAGVQDVHLVPVLMMSPQLMHGLAVMCSLRLAGVWLAGSRRRRGTADGLGHHGLLHQLRLPRRG
ncbi:hypothetical protein AXK61_03330 [Tsukamurella pseudospumae]|uniref:Uncharacterized protein n=1 Tax=Tsukamurella pseudospumae TaxID=239498 RepID=A0A137ZKF9_9ACTN|nr:hypothetical protein AXK61_03330 [Tsukamurella pseudospumae]